MSERIEVSVIIVNWNSGKLLEECLRSLEKEEFASQTQIIVVDNGSKDSSAKLEDKFPRVQFIHCEQNLGFAKACNLGAQNASGRYYLFLNPDTTVYQNSILKTFEFMEKPESQNIAVCGIQLLDSQGHVARSCSRFPSSYNFFASAVALDKVLPSQGAFMKDWDHLSDRVVDEVIGAFFFVRKNIFLKLEGLDEQFFVYYEEIDFCKRAYDLGFKTFYLSSVQAYHLGGGTTDQIKATRLFYSLRSRLQYAKKHFTTFGYIFTFVVTYLIEPLTRIMQGLLRFSISSIMETLRGYRMLAFSKKS